MADKGEDHSMMLSHRLGQAILKGELERVKMYIEQAGDVNRECYAKVYPLELACRSGHVKIMEELLKAGAHPDQVSGMLSQPAMLIAADTSVLTLSMLRCLISHGANVDFRDDRGKTVLHYLARGQCQFCITRDNLLSAAKLALDNGASVDARDRCNRTPLLLACRSGNINLVKLFIAKGADVNYDIGDEPMLKHAAVHCDIDMFDSLVNAGANRHLNFDALANPCDQNNRAMIARILDTCDMDINMLRNLYGGRNILHYACGARYITSETVRLLLDRGAYASTVSTTGDTVLHYAVIQCDCNKIRQLLSYNAPLNKKNNKNQTPLVKLSQDLITHYSQSRQQAHAYYRIQVDTQGQCHYVANTYQAGLLAFKMLVTAGAKVTADVEKNLNQFYIKHPEAQLPVYEINSPRSLQEMCRFVIRGTIPVPVDVSPCKLPIPKLLQEYLNFPECDQLVDKYLNLFAVPVATTTTTTTATTSTTTISITTAITSTTSTSMAALAVPPPPPTTTSTTTTTKSVEEEETMKRQHN